MGPDPAEELTVSIGGRDGRLELTLVGRQHGETHFRAAYRDKDFFGSVDVSDFHADGLVPMFEDIARHWRGFEGAKSWEDLEGRLSLTATADTKGHVTIAVRIVRHLPDAVLEADLVVEAGQWPTIITQLKQLFPNQ